MSRAWTAATAATLALALGVLAARARALATPPHPVDLLLHPRAPDDVVRGAYEGSPDVPGWIAAVTPHADSEEVRACVLLALVRADELGPEVSAWLASIAEAGRAPDASRAARLDALLASFALASEEAR